MALVNLGISVTGISGSIGGITFARCKAGTTARQWRKPSNPNSTTQQATRARTSMWPQLWKDMDQADRDDWDALAATPPETDYDPFGNVVLRSGYNWFVRLNNRRMYTYQDPILVAPAGVTPAAPTISAFYCYYPTDVSGMVYITFTDDEFAAGEYVVTHINFAGSVGNVSKTTDFRVVGCELGNGITESDVTMYTLIRFGIYNLGWLATVRVYRQTEDSFRSVPTILRTEVIDEP